MNKFGKIFFIVLLGSTVSAVRAPAMVIEDKRLDDRLIKSDMEISQKIQALAKDVDIALAGGKTVDTTNLTRLVIRNQLDWPSGSGLTYTPHFDLRLRLPNLEKKWALKFTTYNENQETLGVNKDRIRTTPLTDQYGTGLYFFQKLGEINAEFQPQVELQGQVTLSYLLRLTSSASLKHFQVHPDLQLFARSDTGTGEYLAANCDFPIYKTLTFSLINEEQYVDRANIFSTNNGFSFGYAYNEVMQQSYALIYELSSRPNYQLNRYTVSTTFTHHLYQNVLHYIVQPYLAFTSDLNFAVTPGVNLELDLIF